MDALTVTIALLLGLAARQVNLPPLVGFLAAGFWQLVQTAGKVRMVLLTMASLEANLQAAQEISSRFGRDVFIGAAARFADETGPLQEAGVHTVFDFHEQAGIGLGAHVTYQLESQDQATTATVKA